MVCEDTLKVKNLPRQLNDAEIEEFLKHFGAIKVKIISSKAKQKGVAFAKFETKEVAREVLFRLHQTYVLKSRLCVEYADQEIGPPKIKQVEENTKCKEYFTSFINKLNAFNHCVDFYQPPLPNLKYLYPKANRLTINNIGHALATVPKFYVQVLHLMNRMNMPPPFVLPDPTKMPAPQAVEVAKPVVATETKLKESSSESELESDNESQSQVIIPQKRTLPQKKLNKRPKFMKPPVITNKATRTDKIEDVFEKTGIQTQQKIEMKIPASIPESGASRESTVHESEADDLKTAEGNEERTVITEQELSANRIPERDLDVLPVFKNYHPGPPTSRLYIKNIAKNVEVKDIEFIFNRYKTIGEGTNFDIKLMQEGRMKGQAFITLNSVEVAQKALKETNAYILKEKPMVVMFAKTVTNKK